MLSQTAEYALRATLYLARQPAGEIVAVTQIADALAMPTNYLAKTLGAMTRGGILKSKRGPRGGFCLAADPSTLAIATIFRTVDPAPTQAMCLLGGRLCNAAEPCASHHLWSAVLDRAEAAFGETTVAALLKPSITIRS